MNSTFELQIDFKNDCNWICAVFVELKICRYIRLHKRHGIYYKKTQEWFIFKKLYSKQCNHDRKLQMMLQKTVSVFSQA